QGPARTEEMTDRFSVLMSVYAKERPEHLATALDSVFAQSLPPDEVVLVKDGPLPDALEAVIAACASRQAALRVGPLEKHVGPRAALNVGLGECRNELVARMDSDDICVPDRFESQIPLFERDGKLAVVGSWITEFEHDPARLQSVRSVPQTHAEIARIA